MSLSLPGTSGIVTETVKISKHGVVAPNGQLVEVARTTSYEFMGDKGGWHSTFDQRARVFTCAGQGETSLHARSRTPTPLKNPGFCHEQPRSIPLTDKLDATSWRAVEGVAYEEYGFVKTQHGTAFYNPADPIQKAAAQTCDAAGRIWGWKF